MSKRLLLQPDLVLGGIITDLTPEILQANQIEGLILDVDETLVPIKEDAVTPELARWAEEMRQVASIWLVSNNLSHNRIGNIARSLDLPYFLGARKPSRRKLLRAAMAMNLPVEKVAMVGDRLFTDVIAGNRLGMFTILVEPMVNPLIAEREYPIRNFEVWISEILGVTLATKK
jgi:HAD superfamily phosphatase (TIGR01668 family)